MIGIGAYEPQWFMHTAHTSTEDAIKGFKGEALEAYALWNF